MKKRKGLIPMRKLMDKIKKNNKGFTLVELIVVVAILAIITVVVAPQYLEYVEKSRIGTDENALGEIAHVAEIAFVEKQASDTPLTSEQGKPATTDLTVTIASGAYTGDLREYVVEVIPEGQYKFVSKLYKDAGSVKITVTNGVAKWDKLSTPKLNELTGETQ